MLENMTAFDLAILMIGVAVVSMGGSVLAMKIKDMATSIYHERHQDNKIKEHDMRLSHLEKKN